MIGTAVVILLVIALCLLMAVGLFALTMLVLDLFMRSVR